MAKNYAYLIQVNAVTNKNKFYEITENDDGTLDVNYGRVGSTNMHHRYMPYEKSFRELLNEKQCKGYEDRTALHSETDKSASKVTELSFAPVPDKKVQDVLDLLIDSSREFMQNNYTIKSTEISEKMIKEAEADIETLNQIASDYVSQNALYRFNQKLQDLFTDIPRKMTRVDEHLAKTEKDFETIIKNEQAMLDNVKGIILQTKTVEVKDDSRKEQTALEAYGIEMRPVTYKEEDQILDHLGFDYDGRNLESRYVKAFAVENHDTRKAYEEYKEKHHMNVKDTRLFYHGSKVENWYSIIKTGLILNPNASLTASMFGKGLYFAPELRKSLNYMDVAGSHWNSGKRHTGYCAVYSVALGNCYQPNYILGSSFSGKDLPTGTHSVYAKKGTLSLRNDEYIVYNQAACTIKYLLEMTEQKVRTKEYNLDRKVLRNVLDKGIDSLIKTENGVKAEIMIEELPKPAQIEIEAKITEGFDYNRLFIDYNASTDRVLLSIETVGKKDISIRPSLTNDDYAFLSREMKKVFAESENEWEELMQTSKECVEGKEVINKSGKKNGISKQDKKQVIKE